MLLLKVHFYVINSLIKSFKVIKSQMFSYLENAPFKTN